MIIPEVHVYEVCMALPDMVCVIVRDQELEWGHHLELSSPDSGDMFSYQQRDLVTGAPSTTSGRWARVQGQKDGVPKMYLRFTDVKPTKFLNRGVVDTPANWGPIGGRNVTAVYRKSYPFGQGATYNPSEGTMLTTTMEHKIFLQLNGPLPQGGPYNISCSDAFPDTSFFFNDKETRAVSLHASMTGFRPGDKSKIADFILWVPGRGVEGRVNIQADYGITQFYLINAAGDQVFPGTLSTFIDATTKEEAAIADITYASSTTPPRVATNVSIGSTCVVRVPSHGFVTGQQKILRNIGTPGPGYFANGALEGTAWTIGIVNDDHFSLHYFDGTTGTLQPVDTSGAPAAWAPGVFDPGHDSLVYNVFKANRWATTVTRADFSNFTTPGYYRVYIPGVGVSDQFLIHDSVRFTDAQVHMKGYYNQLSGTPLRADVGEWERPVDFKHGVNGVQMKLSLCPAFFASETGTIDPNTVYPVHYPARTPWLTATTVPGWGTSIRDAGDWDYHAYRHCVMAYWLLEYGYLQLPAARRNVHLGFPKASELIGSTYSGIDTLGDAVHMALAQLDTFRANQQPDGRIYGGMQFDATYTGNPSSGGGGNGEPSWCTTEVVCLLEADASSNYHYAQAAAKMADAFYIAGQASLGDTWKASAIAAWNWAETQYQEWLAHNSDTNLAAAVNIQAHYNTRCGYAAKKGLNAAGFHTAMGLLFNSNVPGVRVAAAGALYHLTNSTTYGDVVSALFAVSHQTEIHAMGSWEFCQASSVDTHYPSQRIYYEQQWTGNVTSERAWTEKCRAFFSPLSTREATNQHLKLIQDTISFDSGRNPAGISMSPGIGTRYPHNILLRDREYEGLPSSNTPGVPVYNNLLKAPHAGIYVNNFSSDSPLNWTAESPTGLFESSGGRAKLLTPIRFLVPIYESFRDNSYMIYMTEFTAQETVVPRIINALICHCYDGNNVETTTYPRMRIKMRAG